MILMVFSITITVLIPKLFIQHNKKLLLDKFHTSSLKLYRTFFVFRSNAALPLLVDQPSLYVLSQK